MMKRVLVPLDEPSATEDVMPIVAMLATAGAAVRLIHVAPVPGHVVSEDGRTAAPNRQRRRALLRTSKRSSCRTHEANDRACVVHG